MIARREDFVESYLVLDVVVVAEYNFINGVVPIFLSLIDDHLPIMQIEFVAYGTNVGSWSADDELRILVPPE